MMMNLHKGRAVQFLLNGKWLYGHVAGFQDGQSANYAAGTPYIDIVSGTLKYTISADRINIDDEVHCGE